MDTQESSGRLFRFIILIPHKDVLASLRAYREKLFATGHYGAYSFPLAAPLAAVSRAFSREELKELAQNIRSLTKKQAGKILSDSTALANYDDKMAFFGPSLNFRLDENTFPQTARVKILHILSSPVICAALAEPLSATPQFCESPFPGQQLSFRAASLANLAIRPLDCGAQGFSFEWKIGPHIWLPKYKEKEFSA